MVYLFSYFTNTLILPAINGPTEGLMLIYLCHFFTAIVGKVQLLVNLLHVFKIRIRDTFSLYNFFNVDSGLDFCSFPGAEWWAQQFGKSVPFLNWVPLIDGKAQYLDDPNTS